MIIWDPLAWKLTNTYPAIKPDDKIIMERFNNKVKDREIKSYSPPSLWGSRNE